MPDGFRHPSQQYEKIEKHLGSRRNAGKYLSEKLGEFEELQISPTPLNVVHDFYILGMKVSHLNSRDKLAEVLRACGIDFVITNYSNLQELPAFYPFSNRPLPNAVELNNSSFLGLYLCGYEFTEQALNSIVSLFESIFESGICRK